MFSCSEVAEVTGTLGSGAVAVPAGCAVALPQLGQNAAVSATCVPHCAQNAIVRLPQPVRRSALLAPKQTRRTGTLELLFLPRKIAERQNKGKAIIPAAGGLELQVFAQDSNIFVAAA